MEFLNYDMKRIEGDQSYISVGSLELSLHTLEALKRAGINTLGDIVSHEIDYYTFENGKTFDSRCRKELMDVVSEKGLKFKE